MVEIDMILSKCLEKTPFPVSIKRLAREIGLGENHLEEILRNDERFNEYSKGIWERSERGEKFADNLQLDKPEQVNDPRPYREPLSPEDYFTKDKDDNPKSFIPKLLAEDIMEDFIIKTALDNEQLYLYHSGVYVDGENRVKAICGQRLDSYTRITRVRETIHHIKLSTYFERNSAPVNLINMKNGFYDLDSNDFIKHDPKIFTVTQIPVHHDSDADCPEIKKFLSEVLMPNDIQVAREIIGYCLYRAYPIHKLVMLLGDGSNGKSTFLEMLNTFLGKDNITHTPLQEFERNRFANVRLYGKLANTYGDLTDEALQKTGVIKTLTGGDSIFGEKKFKDGFNFTNNAKLIFSANKLPEANDDTDAFFRRWIFLNFPNKFEGFNADTGILKKITTPDELSGLFNWVIPALKKLLEKGQFSSSMSTEEIRDFYERASSPIKAFQKDCILEQSDAFIPKQEVYGVFVGYCKNNGLPTMSENTFSSKLKQCIAGIFTEKRIVGKKSDGKPDRKNCWVGITLKDYETPEKDQKGVGEYV